MDKARAVKTAIIAAVLGAGAYACLTMDARVVSALKEVQTIRMSRTAFRSSVPAKGNLYEENGIWYAATEVDESCISKVSVGQDAEITGAALAQPIYGTVEEISDTAQTGPEGTSVGVKIRLEGGEDLRGGYSIKGSIYTDEARLLNTLPYEVIRQDDDGEYVYVYSGNKALRREIETGVELSGETEIVKGLSEKTEVIAAPDEVTDNALVRKGTER